MQADQLAERTSNQQKTAYLIWDLPLRLFHWLLVIFSAISIYTGLDGGFVEMDYHLWSGYSILALLIFRLIWGCVAKGNARFCEFITGPRKIVDYISTGNSHSVGHNPLGALSIVTILGALIVQVTTGLFANDDVLTEGPLVHLVDADTSSLLTTIHHYTLWVIGAWIGLHLAAIAFYELRQRNRLVIAMITGKKYLASAPKVETTHRLILALVIATLSALGAYGLVNYL